MHPIQARSQLNPNTRWVCSSLVNTHAEQMLRSDNERSLYFSQHAPLISLEVQRKVGCRK